MRLGGPAKRNSGFYIKCQKCSVEFYTTPSERRKFCSQVCAREMNKAIDMLVACHYCGNEFKAKMSNVKRGYGKYCGQECAGIHKAQLRQQQKKADKADKAGVAQLARASAFQAEG